MIALYLDTMLEKYGWGILEGLTLRRFFALLDINYIKGIEMKQEQTRIKVKQSAEIERQKMVNQIKQARGIKK